MCLYLYSLYEKKYKLHLYRTSWQTVKILVSHLHALLPVDRRMLPTGS